MKLVHALKEWAVAVDALEKGETILLLRKGGIREEGGSFTIAHQKVLLYPTYEHQKPHLLKTAYANQVEPVPSGWHPSKVRIGSWAKITDIFQVSAEETLSALLPFHIWNEQFVHERFGWKPRQPLSVLLLRVYTFTQEKMLPFRPEYGGCRSWMDLAEPISVEDSIPVMEDSTYAQRVTAIRKFIHAG
ncbi:MAG: DUF1802 family protein [Gloeobacterales cyanobacterium]